MQDHLFEDLHKLYGHNARLFLSKLYLRPGKICSFSVIAQSNCPNTAALEALIFASVLIPYPSKRPGVFHNGLVVLCANLHCAFPDSSVPSV
jgi:hypothetical protein